MNRFLIHVWGSVLAFACIFPSISSAALILEFDYSFDEDGFFDVDLHPERREILELAGDIVNRFTDELAGIEPSNGNSWTGRILRPDNGSIETVSGTIDPGVVRVYVGGDDLGDGSALAFASPGNISATGDPVWRDNVFFRGQSGARSNPPTDNSPWGGTISFNSNESMNWYFGKTIDGIKSDGPDAEMDFLTIAMHEIFHLIGFGEDHADSFAALAETGSFTGDLALDEAAQNSTQNKNLELDSGLSHWIKGTDGVVAGRSQEALMVPNFERGKRLYPVALDYAVMEDIGWEPALPGDVDRNRKVDPFDISQILSANSFSQGEGFGWSAGDNDGDSDVDPFDIVNILTNGIDFPGTYATLDDGTMGDTVDVIVNTQSGNITVDTHGLELTSLIIESEAGIFSGPASPQWDSVGEFSADNDEIISNALLNGSFQGVEDLGDSILVALDPGFNLLQDLRVTYLAAGASETALGTVVGVPEPSSFVLLVLASALLFKAYLLRYRK